MHSLSLSKPGNPELFTVRSPLAPGRRCDLAFWTPLPRRLSLPPQSLPPLWRLGRRPLRVPGCSPSAELSAEEKEWLKKLPDKKKPLYSHSLPCIEAWLKSLDFYQSSEDMAVWFVEKPDWHAQLSLDITDLFIRYLKSGPGSLEKDVERRFSYALSREDIEKAILGGP